MSELKDVLMSTMQVYDDAGGRLFQSRHNLFDLMISQMHSGVGSTDTTRLMTIPKKVTPDPRNQLTVAKKQIKQLILEISELKHSLMDQLQ